MVSASPFSRPRAKAGAPSVRRFSHRSWIAVRGDFQPTRMARKMIAISAKLQERR